MPPSESDSLINEPPAQDRRRFCASLCGGIALMYVVAFSSGAGLAEHSEYMIETHDVADTYTYMDNENTSHLLSSYIPVVEPVYATKLSVSLLSFLSSVALTISGFYLQSQFGESKALIHCVTMSAGCDVVYHLNDVIVTGSFLAGNYTWLNYLNFYTDEHPQNEPTAQCVLSAWLGTFFGLSSTSWNMVVIVYLFMLVRDAETGGEVLRTYRLVYMIGAHSFTWSLSLVVCLVAQFTGSYRHDLDFPDGTPMYQYTGLSYSWGGAFQQSCSLTGRCVSLRVCASSVTRADDALMLSCRCHVAVLIHAAKSLLGTRGSSTGRSFSTRAWRSSYWATSSMLCTPSRAASRARARPRRRTLSSAASSRSPLSSWHCGSALLSTRSAYDTTRCRLGSDWRAQSSTAPSASSTLSSGVACTATHSCSWPGDGPQSAAHGTRAMI